MNKVEFNINNCVEFELTEYGANILDKHNEHYATAFPQVKSFQNKPKHFAGEWERMPMWAMMSVFGNKTSLGLETFCKNATITLEVK